MLGLSRGSEQGLEILLEVKSVSKHGRKKSKLSRSQCSLQLSCSCSGKGKMLCAPFTKVIFIIIGLFFDLIISLVPERCPSFRKILNTLEHVRVLESWLYCTPSPFVYLLVLHHYETTFSTAQVLKVVETQAACISESTYMSSLKEYEVNI